MPELSNLPKDMLGEIFSYLNFSDLKKVRKLSHFFNQASKNDFIRLLKEKEVEQIAFGTDCNYTLFKMKNGEVWFSGQRPKSYWITDPETDMTAIPKKIEGLENIKSIFSFEDRIFLIKNDGSACGAGKNFVGELGIGSIGWASNFSKVLIPNKIIQISKVFKKILFLDEKGNVWISGNNDNPGPRTEYINSPQQLKNLTDVKQMVSDESLIVFLKNDGTVWIKNFSPMKDMNFDPIQDPKLNNIIHISICEGATAYLDKNGKAIVRSKKLLKKNFVEIERYQIQIDDVRHISMGHDFFLSVKKDGTVWIGRHKSTLDLDEIEVTKPMQMGDLSNVKEVQIINKNKSADSERKYIIMFTLDNGKKLFIGVNKYGQLGLGHTDRVNGPSENPTLNRWQELLASVTDEQNKIK